MPVTPAIERYIEDRACSSRCLISFHQKRLAGLHHQERTGDVDGISVQEIVAAERVQIAMIARMPGDAQHY